jgi:predicted dehydrogenase
MSAPTKIGVVGAGALGYHHVRILRELPEAELVGFHESRTERSAQIASELGVPAFDSLDRLIDEVEALTIVVPTPAHFGVARRALEAGRHLLIEKPIAATLAEADELLEIGRRSGALVQTGHVERFNRAVRAVLPHVENPRFIQSDRLAPFNPRGSDVAVVLDLMIHDIDLVLTLAGSKVSSLSAVGIPVLTPFVDIANARLNFENGAVANITASRVSRDRLRKHRIFQRSGYLALDLSSGSADFFRLREDVDLHELAKTALALEDYVERVPLEAPQGEPLRLEFASFLSAIRGDAPIAVTGEDGRDALAVALRIVDEIDRTLRDPAGDEGSSA